MPTCMTITKVLLSIFVCSLILVYLNHDADGAIRRHWPKPTFSVDNITTLEGMVVLITGANVGLGRESAMQLARKGAKVVLACRSSCDAVAQDINKAYGKDRALSMSLDLSDSRSIYDFAEKYRSSGLPIHVLMLNAGVMTIPDFRTTADGMEMQVGVNWLGHFYLQHLLQDIVEKSAPSRIVILTSKGHSFFRADTFPLPIERTLDGNNAESRQMYSMVGNYGKSKLLNIWHAQELAERMRAQKKQVAVIAVHPGAVDTELARFIFEWIEPYLGKTVLGLTHSIVRMFFTLTVEEGALTQLWAATSPEIDEKDLSGAYAVPQARIGQTSKLAQNKDLQKKLWAEGERLIANFPRVST